MTNKTMSDEQIDALASPHYTKWNSRVDGDRYDFTRSGLQALMRDVYAFAQAQHTPDAVPQIDVDQLAQFIRCADGNNKLGADALAERICEWLGQYPTAAIQQDRESVIEEAYQAAEKARRDNLQTMSVPVIMLEAIRALKLKDVQPAPEARHISPSVIANVQSKLEAAGFKRVNASAAPASETALTDERIARIYEQVFNGKHGRVSVAPHCPPIVISLARAILQAAQPVARQGFVLVPKVLTPEMDAILREEDWQWEDLLAAAEAITEQEYNELASSQPVAVAQPQGELPELPKHHGYVGEEAVYYASDMRDYARAALAGQQEGWISVDERLPEEGEEVFVSGAAFGEPDFSRGRFYCSCVYIKGAFLDPFNNDSRSQPTHWMRFTKVSAAPSQGTQQVQQP